MFSQQFMEMLFGKLPEFFNDTPNSFVGNSLRRKISGILWYDNRSSRRRVISSNQLIAILVGVAS